MDKPKRNRSRKKNRYIHRDGKVVQERHCSRCGKWLPTSEFSVRKDGYFQSFCRPCLRAYNINWVKKRKLAGLPILSAEAYKRQSSKIKLKYRNDPEYRYFWNSYRKMYQKYGKEDIAPCEECRQWKHKGEFYQKRGTKRGVAEACKECMNKDSSIRLSGRIFKHTNYFQQKQNGRQL